MKNILVLLMCIPMIVKSSLGVPEEERNLTDGNIKRWVYEKTRPTLGTECNTHYLTYHLENHEFQKTPCKEGQRSRDMLTDIAENHGTWKITQNEDGEYEITMNKEVYNMKIFSKEGTKFLRLREKSTNISESTNDQIYHEE